jgi:hypothetical protein
MFIKGFETKILLNVLNRSTNIITTNTEYTIDPQSNIEEQYAKSLLLLSNP